MNKKFVPQSIDGVSPLKKVAAIHDLSCFGRCALTVIMPTLSAMGLQTVPVPTCLLSSHTGGFTDMYFEDQTEAMEKIAAHFKRLDLHFDAIYTGFLGSSRQISSVNGFIRDFAEPDTLVLVDPVMGDDGALYSTYTDELMRGMSELCRGADIITPNLTEACFLTGTDYRDTSVMSAAELSDFSHELCRRLSGTGARKIVVTGLHAGAEGLYVCGFDSIRGDFFDYGFPRVKKDYPGTGDLFASVLLGTLLRGESFEESVHAAADFTSCVMRYSSHFATAEREGVAFEAFLGELANASPNV